MASKWTRTKDPLLGDMRYSLTVDGVEVGTVQSGWSRLGNWTWRAAGQGSTSYSLGAAKDAVEDTLRAAGRA